MTMIRKYKDKKDLDGKSVFINKVISLVVDRHRGDLRKSLEELEDMWDEFGDDALELTDTEIPMWELHYLLRGSMNNLEVEEDLNVRIKVTMAACREYYPLREDTGMVSVSKLYDDDNTLYVLEFNGSGDPVKSLDDAVFDCAAGRPYKEFIDANMDNPWVRIVMLDLDNG